mgnify:CR=1 FL=1
MSDAHLRRELARLDGLTVTMLERIIELENRLDKLEKLNPNDGIAPLTPLTDEERKPDENGHIIIDDHKKRERCRKLAAAAKNGPIRREATQLVITCDELNCVAQDHLDIVPVATARRINSERVAKELESLDRDTVRFAVESMTTTISDGHVASTTESTYPLPSGRKISLLRAVYWAYSGREHAPAKINRVCGRKDCYAYQHLSLS